MKERRPNGHRISYSAPEIWKWLCRAKVPNGDRNDPTSSGMPNMLRRKVRKQKMRLKEWNKKRAKRNRED
jgi:hypothetical protein